VVLQKGKRGKSTNLLTKYQMEGRGTTDQYWSKRKEISLGVGGETSGAGSSLRKRRRGDSKG